MKSRKKLIIIAVITLAVIVYILLVVFRFNPMSHSPYDSYTKQAMAWLEGRTDLGQDYPYLELARYQGKVYVSFPPVPSIPLIPFVLFYGENTPNNLLCLIYSIISFIALFALFHRKKPAAEALLWAALGTVGTNLVCITAFGGVWHEAQTLSFMLCSLAALGVTSEKPVYRALGMFSWALAVGCRPFVLFGFPLLYLLLYKSVKVNGKPVLSAKKTLPYLIPPVIVALVLMWYNYIRFNNPFEFGHTYLNEFLNEGGGQFDFSYFTENLRNIFRLPYLVPDTWPVQFSQFNAFAFYFVNPIIIIYFVSSILDLLYAKRMLAAVTFICVAANFFFTLLHKTLGGFQFGARYFIDMIPFMLLYLYITGVKAGKLEYALCTIGIGFNIYGALYVLKP